MSLDSTSQKPFLFLGVSGVFTKPKLKECLSREKIGCTGRLTLQGKQVCDCVHIQKSAFKKQEDIDKMDKGVFLYTRNLIILVKHYPYMFFKPSYS